MMLEKRYNQKECKKDLGGGSLKNHIENGKRGRNIINFSGQQEVKILAYGSGTKTTIFSQIVTALCPAKLTSTRTLEGGFLGLNLYCKNTNLGMDPYTLTNQGNIPNPTFVSP
ncbi:MAG: hypothetical protein HQK96_19935 [Nitrospirae bacterium]|nr:hypothetical protein [Nitrospirota bacterium]